MASQEELSNLKSQFIKNAFTKVAGPVVILLRDESGIIGPDPNPVHTISCINSCRHYLGTEEGNGGLQTLATRYSSGRKNCWYLQGPTPMSMEQVTHSFVRMVYLRFPIVLKDHTMRNPDNKGCNVRRPWQGEFDPGSQAISLNADASGPFPWFDGIYPRAS